VNNFTTLTRKVHSKQFQSDVDDSRRPRQQCVTVRARALRTIHAPPCCIVGVANGARLSSCRNDNRDDRDNDQCANPHLADTRLAQRSAEKLFDQGTYSPKKRLRDNLEKELHFGGGSVRLD
jgi:hypothetical protein